MMDLPEHRKEKVIVLFFEKGFVSSQRNLCMKTNSLKQVLGE